MRDSSLKEQLRKPMTRDSLEKMPAEVDTTLTSMHMVVLEPIFVEKNQPLSSLSKVSQVGQD